MNIGAWYKKRGFRFISERARSLNERYGLSPAKSIKRIEECVQALEVLGCYPTFAVPGIVVEHNLPFVRRLQDQGVEIAVHGYNHIDLKVYSPENANHQLLRAAELFHASGLEVHGFRCPYLSVTDELIKAIPPGVFEYSSNKAIQWSLGEIANISEESFFQTIQEFYLPSQAESKLSVPWQEPNLIEIPVCVPDDLQLHDGLKFDLVRISKIWSDILRETHRRGEVFNLMFHPELASFCQTPFVAVLEEAITLRPTIWLARLREISSWWKEKSTFCVEIVEQTNNLRIAFICSERATILARRFANSIPGNFWDGQYLRLQGHEFTLPLHPRPFIGLSNQVSPAISAFLREQGYIVETGDKASDCGIYIDERTLACLNDQVQLINYIEQAPGPLIRLWRWPSGYKSALCITGDLDALSLFDYISRLFPYLPLCFSRSIGYAA